MSVIIVDGRKIDLDRLSNETYKAIVVAGIRAIMKRRETDLNRTEMLKSSEPIGEV